MDVSVAHAIRGRIRLRVGALKDNPAVALELQDRLQSVEGLQQLEVNPACGSVVLRYNRDEQDQVVASLCSVMPGVSEGDLRNGPSNNGKPHGSLAEEIEGLFRIANERVEKTTGGLDLKVIVPLALLALACLGLLIAMLRRRKISTPSWYDLIWFAFNTFVILNLSVASRSIKENVE